LSLHLVKYYRVEMRIKLVRYTSVILICPLSEVYTYISRADIYNYRIRARKEEEEEFILQCTIYAIYVHIISTEISYYEIHIDW
jgi:hypothetical protein